MNKIDYSRFAKLDSHQLKDELIALADSQRDLIMLSAGRGNPNFVATRARRAFFELGLFAVAESEESFAYLPGGVGGFARGEELLARFEHFQSEPGSRQGAALLHKCLAYVRDQMGLDGEAFLLEMVNGILGCNYPVPDRMLRFSETITKEYLTREMGATSLDPGSFDLFAVEGATAAMTYIFETLTANRLITVGDRIAIGSPIPTSYVELPAHMDRVFIDADPHKGWQYPESELRKLEDTSIKAFLLANPSNPPSVRMDDASLGIISDIVRKRPDLIVVTDDVYGGFADGFRSLFAVCPRNTILVYSFSKYFGATGWRLGVVAVARDNVLDHAIAGLEEDDLRDLDNRYSSLTPEPRRIKFIDRLVAESRAVALTHTAGLSTPQQVQMVLFALCEMVDLHQNYRQTLGALVRRRDGAVHARTGGKRAPDANSAGYYTQVDLEKTCRELWGGEFADWVIKTQNPREILFRIAEDTGVVLLPGSGLQVQHPSGRASLANLQEHQYAAIGASLRKLAEEYYEEFSRTRKRKK